MLSFFLSVQFNRAENIVELSKHGDFFGCEPKTKTEREGTMEDWVRERQKERERERERERVGRSDYNGV